MAKKREYDFNIIKSLTPQQMRQAAAPLVSLANKRLRRLENAGVNFGVSQRVKKELARMGRQKFSARAKNIENELGILIDFLQSPTSTLTGIKQARSKTLDTIRSKYDLEISNPDVFFNFLSSQQFKEMSQRIDSNQLIEDIDTMLQLGASIGDIKEMYHDFLNTQITYDEAINIQLSRMGDMLR